MTTELINFDGAPDEPLERLIWLSGVQEVVDAALEVEYRRCYYSLRLQGRFLAALSLGYHSKKRALAWTRYENNRSGRNIRWGDRLDATSNTYRG